MSISETENAGRTLRPRHFVPLPTFMVRDHDWLYLPDGNRRWVGKWGHPEIADLVRRLIALVERSVGGRCGDTFTDRDWETFNRVEKVILHADHNWGWWLARLDVERLLPDAPERPDPESVAGAMPSSDSFILLLGAIHRIRSWLERAEAKYGVAKYPFMADVVAAAFNGQPEPI